MAAWSIAYAVFIVLHFSCGPCLYVSFSYRLLNSCLLIETVYVCSVHLCAWSEINCCCLLLHLAYNPLFTKFT